MAITRPVRRRSFTPFGLIGAAWALAGFIGCVATWPDSGADATGAGRAGSALLLTAGLAMATICWAAGSVVTAISRQGR